MASEYCDAGPDCPADQRLEFTDTKGRDRVWDKRITRRVVTKYTAWLRDRFGDEIVYLHWDCDEDGLHFHAIHLRIEEHAPTQRYVYGRALIRSRGHPLIGETRDEDGVPVTGYEVSQDDVAAWFAEPECADMGLVRGHRTAEQERRLGALTDWLVEHMPAPRPMSKKAHKRWALRKVMEDPTAMSLNNRDVEKLGLDLLIAAGRIPERRLKEKSTVRWRQEMLREYGGALVDVDDLRRDPVSAYERVLAKVAQDARSERRDLAELDAREGAAAAREAANIISFADAQRRYEDRLAAEKRGELKAQVAAEIRVADEERRLRDEAAEGRCREADAAAALRRRRNDEAAATTRREADADAAHARRRKQQALDDEHARIDAERAAHDARVRGFEAGREMMREGVYYWDLKTKKGYLRLQGEALEEARRMIAPAREDLRPALIAEAEASEARGAARAADEKRARADAEAAQHRDQEAEAARSQIAARLGLIEVLEAALPQFERPEDRFPDAWAMQHPKDDAAFKRLDDDLARMTNRQVRQVAVASRDGAALCEPGELQQRFHRGWRVLSFEAGRRGLCLDTGEHHPDRATDSMRARIHTDQEPCPIRIIQRTLARQRTI